MFTFTYKALNNCSRGAVTAFYYMTILLGSSEIGVQLHIKCSQFVNESQRHYDTILGLRDIKGRDKSVL